MGVELKQEEFVEKKEFEFPDGILLVDKPEGKTSTWVDNLVKRKVKKKVGHIGTIDPIASGLLPIAIGKATKLIPFIIEGDREYIVEILLGKRTDTDDITGKVIYEIPEDEVMKIPDEKIVEVIKSFVGSYDQVPPYYSAKKYLGKPLYKWAREGKLIELPPVKVSIYDIEILSIKKPYVKIRVVSSAGMYARALARDIGEKLEIDGKKVGGTLSALRRTRAGYFKVEEAIPAQAIKKMTPEQLAQKVLQIKPELLEMRCIVVRGNDINLVKNGTPPKFRVQGETGEIVALCDENRQLVAIGQIERGRILIKRVI